MPRSASFIPRYRKHRASGQAIVTLSAQDFYLGPHGTQASKLAYDRHVAEWLARGRRPLDSLSDDDAGVSNVELIAAYRRFAKEYYRKHGVETREVYMIMSAAAFVRKLYGRECVNDFGPLKLQSVRQAMIVGDWSRTTINTQVGRIVRMFSWGVSQELVRADVAQALREVSGLHRGRSQARETSAVLPVSDAQVHTVLDHLPPIVADMVRLQRLTGARPAEICILRPCDVDTSKEVWSYRPASHKTEHHDRERIVFIGPKGQDVLRPYLLRDKQAFCFVPAESEHKRNEEKRANRQSPMTPSQAKRRPKSNRRRPPGEQYTTNSYRRTIGRACALAFPAPDGLSAKEAKLWAKQHRWAPNRLRHSAATEIRRRYGLEAAQVTLGHASADVSQIYAERDMAKAAAIMREVG